MPLHASICRYDGVTASVETVMQAERQLAAALSRTPGFVSYAVLHAGEGVLISITVFDDRTTLEAAERLIVRWAAEHLGALLPHPPAVTTGEVIVQRGM